MRKPGTETGGEAGFSLIELMVAMGVTLTIMAVAAQMLAMSMNVRTRENQRTEAIADAQRALQAMTRDIGNAGLGLTNNGVYCDNPGETTYGELRIRSNLNAFTEAVPTTDDADEDVVYSLIKDGTTSPSQLLVTRQDVNTGQISQLANRIDGLHFDFLNADDTTAASVAAAAKVKVTVWVTLNAVGSAGSYGYQPPTRMMLSSQVALRNSLLTQ